MGKRSLDILCGSGEDENPARSVISVLISISGFAGAHDRGLEDPDIALSGRRGPTRVASGASSESELYEEPDDVSLSEECLFFVDETVLLGNSTIGRLVGLSALVDTDPRDFAYALMLDEGPLALLTTCGAADLGWVAITGL